MHLPRVTSVDPRYLDNMLTIYAVFPIYKYQISRCNPFIKTVCFHEPTDVP